MDNNTTEPKTTSNSEQRDYQSTTLNADNMTRSFFLPIFPPKTSIIKLGVHDHLLLANVPSSYYLFNLVFIFIDLNIYYR
jgi:hypothetical protein